MPTALYATRAALIDQANALRRRMRHMKESGASKREREKVGRRLAEIERRITTIGDRQATYFEEYKL